MRIGEKSVSEQAVIVARYADLFTLTNLAELRAAEDAEMRPAQRERLHRLRRTCRVRAPGSTPRTAPGCTHDRRARGRRAGRRHGHSLRTAVARLGSLTDYDERETLGKSAMDVSATLNAQRLELVRAGEELQAELSGEPDPIARAEGEKGISLRALADVLVEARDLTAAAYEELRTRWLGRLLGPSRCTAILLPRPVRPTPLRPRERLHEGPGNRRMPGHARRVSGSTWSSPESNSISTIGRRSHRDRR